MTKISRKELRKMIGESLTGTENDPTMRDFNRFVKKTSKMYDDYKERRRRMSVEDRLAALEARVDAMEGMGESLTEARANADKMILRAKHQAGISAKIDRLQAHIDRLQAEIEEIEKAAREAQRATGSVRDYQDVVTSPAYGLDDKRGEKWRYEDQMEFLQSQLDAFEEAGSGTVELPRRD